MFSGIQHKPEECAEVLQDRLAACKAQKSLALDLTDLQLTKIPEEVFEMEWLESLNINGNPDYMNSGFGFNMPVELCNNIKQLPRQLSRLKNLTALYIEGNSIRDISVLSELTSLKEFRANGNQIQDIEVLGHLPHLHRVELSFNSVRTIPVLKCCTRLELTHNDLNGTIVLDGFTALEFFQASNNDITMLTGVSALQSLTTVWIQSNEFSDLPDFSGAHKLRELVISGNKISLLDGKRLPPSLEVLDISQNKISYVQDLSPRIKEINISSNALEKMPDFPPESKLKWLNFGDNKIVSLSGSQLPRFVEKAAFYNCFIETFDDTDFPSSLSYLDLSNNKIPFIPSITGMEGINTIILSGNGITHIEGAWNFEKLNIIVIERNALKSLEFLGHLPSLSELWLEDNKITDINCLTNYPGLQLLILSNNKLDKLPSNLSNLKRLSELHLHGNKNLMRTIPAGIFNIYEHDEDRYYDTDYFIEEYWEIGYDDLGDLPQRRGGRPPGPLLKWLAAIGHSPKTNKSVRLIFCGNGRVGKSSILDCLQGREFEENKESTHAIAIERLELPDLECWVWDFGGQEIYHSTHRLFMGGNAIYVLVWDEETEKIGEASDPIDSELVNLNFKLHYWVDFIRSESPNSPIIVVQNKSDNNWSFPSEEILPSDLNIRFITAFNAQNGMGKEQLEFFIQQAARSLPEYNMTVPETWWNVRDYLLMLKTGQEKTTMTFEEFDRLCLDKQVHPSHNSVLLDYLQEISIIYVLERFWNETIIVNDMWFVQPIYKVFERGTPFFRDLRVSGRFSKERFIENVNKDSRYAPDQIELFLRIMESIGLCFQINKPKASHKEFIVPRFLSNEVPENVEKYFEGLEEKTFYLQYVGAFHYHLIQQFIVATGRKADLDKIGRRGIFFNVRNGIIAYIYADANMGTISTKVAGEHEKERKWVMDAIRLTFREIANKYTYKNLITTMASYDGQSYASVQSINKQYELHKDKKDLIQHLKVEAGRFTDSDPDLIKLLWAMKPDDKANFQKLPDVEQEKIEDTHEKPVGRTPEKPQSLPKEAKRKTLFLFSSPNETNPLNFDREFERIQEAYRSSKYQCMFEEPQIGPCLTKDKLSKLILREKPAIIHFSMHSPKTEGLYFEDKDSNIQPVSPEQLAKYFEVISGEYLPELVILSVCNSEKHAQAILPYCQNVIGTCDFFPDKVSAIYAEALYGHLFNSVNIKTSHEAALLALEDIDKDLHFKNQKVETHKIPILFTNIKQS